MPSSNFCLIPRGVAIQVPMITNESGSKCLGRLGSAPVARAPRWGGGRGGLGLPCRHPQKNRSELIYPAGGPLAQRPRHNV
jgi:hypothetical protein